MSNGLNRKFMRSPARFFRDHLLLQTTYDGGQGQVDVSNPLLFNLNYAYSENGEPKTAVSIQAGRPDREMKVVELYRRPQTKMAGTDLPACYCPYENHRIRRIAVDPTNCSVIFNHVMNGCRYNVGLNAGNQIVALHMADGVPAQQITNARQEITTSLYDQNTSGISFGRNLGVVAIHHRNPILRINRWRFYQQEFSDPRIEVLADRQFQRYFEHSFICFNNVVR